VYFIELSRLAYADAADGGSTVMRAPPVRVFCVRDRLPVDRVQQLAARLVLIREALLLGPVGIALVASRVTDVRRDLDDHGHGRSAVVLVLVIASDENTEAQ
jgi:hypothetical protein